MDTTALAEPAALAARIAAGTARIRECLGLRAWQDALAAASNRHADIEALCALARGMPTPQARAWLESALRDGRALEPDIAHLRDDCRQRLHDAGRRMRAASQYCGLAGRDPRGRRAETDM